MTPSALYEPIRLIEPLADGWRSSTWRTGRFDTAGRHFTPSVEGIIRTPDNVLMVTLSGSAKQVEIKADCGHRYVGQDFAGAVSFVPANCTRHLKMRGVQSQWASISLDPLLFENAGIDRSSSIAPFSNKEDPFIANALKALFEHMIEDDAIDSLYGEAVGHAIARHLMVRYGARAASTSRTEARLPQWKLKRVTEYIDAHLESGLHITDLATIVGQSPGYFHRAFKATTGSTPLGFIQTRRIDRAAELIRTTDLGMVAIAMQTGFVSPSHFARTFRQLKGCNPSAFRRT